MEDLGEQCGLHARKNGQPFNNQHCGNLGKERTLGVRALRADFKLGLRGSRRVGRVQHRKKSMQEPKMEWGTYLSVDQLTDKHCLEPESSLGEDWE
jgi:hypothetical protein